MAWFNDLGNREDGGDQCGEGGGAEVGKQWSEVKGKTVRSKRMGMSEETHNSGNEVTHIRGRAYRRGSRFHICVDAALWSTPLATYK